MSDILADRKSFDALLIWQRHRGGRAEVGVITKTLPAHLPPVLRELHVEEIDYRAGLCALIREHACRQRDMERSEIAAVAGYLRSLDEAFLPPAPIQPDLD